MWTAYLRTMTRCLVAGCWREAGLPRRKHRVDTRRSFMPTTPTRSISSLAPASALQGRQLIVASRAE